MGWWWWRYPNDVVFLRRCLLASSTSVGLWNVENWFLNWEGVTFLFWKLERYVQTRHLCPFLKWNITTAFTGINKKLYQTIIKSNTSFILLVSPYRAVIIQLNITDYVVPTFDRIITFSNSHSNRQWCGRWSWNRMWFEQYYRKLQRQKQFRRTRLRQGQIRWRRLQERWRWSESCDH